jgi:hypothetical protein
MHFFKGWGFIISCLKKGRKIRKDKAMALISEVAKRIYQIKPEGRELESFPLCTVYLIVDDNAALVEASCSVQVSDILKAVSKHSFRGKRAESHPYPRS